MYEKNYVEIIRKCKKSFINSCMKKLWKNYVEIIRKCKNSFYKFMYEKIM